MRKKHFLQNLHASPQRITTTNEKIWNCRKVIYDCMTTDQLI